MVDQAKPSTLEELRRAIRHKEREPSELELIACDYYAERTRLINELRQLCAQLRDAEEAASSVSEP